MNIQTHFQLEKYIVSKYKLKYEQKMRAQNVSAKSVRAKVRQLRHPLYYYDSHFIMQQIGEIAKKHTYKNKRGEECHMNINCIPNNMEKYMAFMLGNHLVFLDSFQFMSSSLDNLIKNLPDEAFKYTQQEFKKEQFNLMKQKGILSL